MISEEADYVLPLRWTDDHGFSELTAYLRELATMIRVTVVDGSADQLWGRHHTAWSDCVNHLRPDPIGCRNGKVAGVLTGLRAVAGERVIIADDDVRYDADSLRQVLGRLDIADCVGPQNVFAPMPWHARWDTARSLLNRAFGADYPGTLAVRSSTFAAMGGYDGDVLFENLELMRTVRAVGGLVDRPRWIYVRRLPPEASRFWSQRVRQAYDDLAQPSRLAWSLPAAPVAVWLAASGRWWILAGGAVGLIAVAEFGRRRDGGLDRYPRSAALLAPLWVAERAVCIWWAMWLRWVRHGVPYAGHRLRVAANRPRTIRRRLGSRSARPLGTAGRGPEVRGLVRTVAERFERRSTTATEGDRSPSAVDLLAVGRNDLEVSAHE
jgi:hypothetical protein